MSGIPSNRAWNPLRTSCLPTSRCPPGAGPRGVSKTQSSVKNAMIASTSCALNASSNACSDGVPTSVLDMVISWWLRSASCIQRGLQVIQVGRAEDDPILRGDVDQIEVDPGTGDLASQVRQHARAVLY